MLPDFLAAPVTLVLTFPEPEALKVTVAALGQWTVSEYEAPDPDVVVRDVVGVDEWDEGGGGTTLLVMTTVCVGIGVRLAVGVFDGGFAVVRAELVGEALCARVVPIAMALEVGFADGVETPTLGEGEPVGFADGVLPNEDSAIITKMTASRMARMTLLTGCQMNHTKVPNHVRWSGRRSLMSGVARAVARVIGRPLPAFEMARSLVVRATYS